MLVDVFEQPQTLPAPLQLVTPMDVTQEALTWPDRARSLLVIDEASYRHAAEFVKGIKGLRQKISNTFGPIVAKAHAAHKEAVGQRKRAEAPLQDAEQIIKASMGAWSREQQRVAQEAARQREEELRRREEEERLAEAVALEADGEPEQAAALIEAPVVVAPVVPQSAAPKVAGISQREVWKATVVDLPALVQAAAADSTGVAAGLLQVNQTALNGLARSLKGALTVPGVKVYTETVMSASGR